MLRNDNTRPASVVGPLGEKLTLDDLPPADLKRWVPRRKAEVVAAVSGGLLSLAEACQRYGLSLEEFAGWQRAVERGGLAGLRATRAQAYRDQWAKEQRREARSREQRVGMAWSSPGAAASLQAGHNDGQRETRLDLPPRRQAAAEHELTTA
jgi:transposase-like protein